MAYLSDPVLRGQQFCRACPAFGVAEGSVDRCRHFRSRRRDPRNRLGLRLPSEPYEDPSDPDLRRPKFLLNFGKSPSRISPDSDLNFWKNPPDSLSSPPAQRVGIVEPIGAKFTLTLTLLNLVKSNCTAWWNSHNLRNSTTKFHITVKTN